jgi:DNA-binding GntR family transcriptional regulator
VADTRKPAARTGPRAVTRSAMAYEALRADILAGRLRPGSKLGFAGLVARYGCSIGALREALQRLAEQSLVVNELQQGFRVVPISAEDLADLTAARCEIEILALRYAIRDGDVDWEAGAVAAHHVLGRARQFDSDDPERFSEEWAVAHERFHLVLLAGCGNRRILATATALRDSAELYRRWSAPLHDRDRDIAGEHRATLAAVIARDEDLAAELLAVHIQRTTDKLLAGEAESQE